MENEAKIERIKTLMENFGVTPDRKTTCQRLTYQQNRRRLGRIERMAMYG